MIKYKKLKPMFNSLITTMNSYENDVMDSNGLIDVTKSKGSLKEYQTVLAIGDAVRGIKVGDMVLVNPSRFGVKKHQEGSLKDGIITDNPVIKYNFNVITMDGQDCLLLQMNDISFVVEKYEELPDIIMPEKPKLQF